jgi:D-alanine-D-alanine ligase
VGITKVAADGDVTAAIEDARRHDPRVIVEPAVEGAREIECGVLVDAHAVPRASACAEIRLREGHEFYDFAAKYLDDSVDLIVPADLDPQVAAQVQDVAVRAFEVLGCEGLARVDFFVTPERLVINEVNTMPGFTSVSMYPRMWAASGVDYPTLVDRLVADAIRRGTGLR